MSGRRFVVLAFVAGVHGSLFLLALAPGGTAANAAQTSAIAIYDVAAPPNQAAHPRVAFDFAEIGTADVQVPAIEVGADVAATSSVSLTPVALTDYDCDLTATVQQAIRDDSSARAALAAMPVAARSVANAVMLWDGHWVDASTPAARAALARVRALVSDTVESASPTCRAAVQAGPRLIVLPGSPDIVLALGSGRWRWGDLAPADLPQSNTTPITIQTGSD